ncbi:MAG: hypothetical protein WCD42_14295, partial [Rhizomicrobium sp.]
VMTLVTLIEMSTSSLDDKDIANGSGQFNFIRTLFGAIATAVVTAMWYDQTKSSKDQLVGALHDPSAVLHAAESAGLQPEMARNLLDQMVQGQSIMQATNTTFLILGLITLAAAGIVWIAPRPPKRTGTVVRGH